MATRVKLLHTGISPTLAGASFTGDVSFEGSQLQYDASSNSLKFQDNIYAQFGTGDDLRIYHNGSNSYIQEAGTGELLIQSNTVAIQNAAGTENMAKFIQDGAVQLYHNDGIKVATSATGATVTGNLTVTGDLDITGNVNSASVTDLDVTDKTITLGVGQTEAQSGSSGIIIDGSNASLLWNETNDEFVFNKNLKSGSLQLTADTTSYNKNANISYYSSTNAVYVNGAGNNGWLRLNASGTANDRTAINLFGLSQGDLITMKTNSTERLRILADGNVGIGLSNPGHPLTVYSAGGYYLSFDRGNSTAGGTNPWLGLFNNVHIGSATYGWGFYDSSSDGSLQLWNKNNNTTGYDVMTFKRGGNVGIGTNSPAAKLHISGNSDVSDEDCQLIIDDVDGSAGSRIPSIQFRSNTGGSVTNQGRIRATDTQGMILSGSSAQGDDLVVQAGKVGINTTSPGVELDVRRTTNGYPLRIGSSQGEGRTIVYADVHSSPNKYNWIAGTQYNVNNGYEITPSTAVGGYTFSTPAIAILSSGNVGINDINPDRMVSIIGNSTSNGQYPLSLDATNTDYTLEFRRNGNSEWWIAQAGSAFRIHENGVGDHFRLNAGGNLGLGTSPGARLHVDGCTNSTAGLMLESNGNGDVIHLQLKAKANNGTLSYHGLTASPGSDQDDTTISLGNGANNGVVVDHKNVANIRYSEIHSGGTFTYDVGGTYLGANGAGFGTHAIFRTPSVTSPTTGSATTQFLTIYSSGHWGEYPVCRFKVYGTYYTGSYREYLFSMTASNAYLNEVTAYSSTTSWGSSPGSITKGSVVDTGTDHSGQNIYKCEISFTTGGAYLRNYVVTEIAYGANTYFGSGTAVSTVDADTAGGKYHFKTISSAEGRGMFE